MYNLWLTQIKTADETTTQVFCFYKKKLINVCTRANSPRVRHNLTRSGGVGVCRSVRVPPGCRPAGRMCWCVGQGLVGLGRWNRTLALPQSRTREATLTGLLSQPLQRTSQPCWRVAVQNLFSQALLSQTQFDSIFFQE